MTYQIRPEGKKYTAVVALQCTQPSVKDGETSQCRMFHSGGSWRGRTYCRWAICLMRWSSSHYFLCGCTEAEGIEPTKED